MFVSSSSSSYTIVTAAMVTNTTTAATAAAYMLIYSNIHYGTLVSPAGFIWFVNLHKVDVVLMLGGI
jgi:hypothetical protein